MPSLNAMFQLNSWIPLLSASSRLAVRIRTWHPSKCLVPACNQHRHSRTASVLVTRRFQHVESATFAQPLEPMLLPKLRIYFADFPWSHCSIDQRLFTSESGCGYRYGQFMREEIDLWRGFLKNSQGTERYESIPLSLCVQAHFLHLK